MNRVDRALTLADRYPSSAAMMRFYAQIAAVQKNIVASAPNDLLDAALHIPTLLDVVVSSGPGPLVEAADAWSRIPSRSLPNMLQDFWNGEPLEEEDAFLAFAICQAFAEGGKQPCPEVHHKPAVSVLDEESQGAKRSLVCGLCSGTWEFSRIRCPNCAETEFEKLPVYTTGQFEHIRVEACDSCKVYLLAVDRTKDGLAIPLVDELAAIPLNIWARDKGYHKIVLNLFGI